MGKHQFHETITIMSVFVKLRRLCRQTSDPTEVGKEAIRLIDEYNNQTYSKGKVYGKWDPGEVSALTDVFASELDKDKAVTLAAERLNRDCSSVRHKARALGLRR